MEAKHEHILAGTKVSTLAQSLKLSVIQYASYLQQSIMFTAMLLFYPPAAACKSVGAGAFDQTRVETMQRRLSARSGHTKAAAGGKTRIATKFDPCHPWPAFLLWQVYYITFGLHAPLVSVSTVPAF